MKRALLIGAGLLLAGAAHAQAVPVVSVTTAPLGPVVSVADAARAIDPAKLEVARQVALKLMPSGTYRTMMKSVMDQLSQNLFKQMMDTPVRDIAKMMGIPTTQLEKLGPGTLHQVMMISDPSFDKRTEITTRLMSEWMVQLGDEMEPDVRAGLADSLAGKFDQAQLGELDRFFATPTGGAYAAQSMQLYTDPAMLRRMQAVVPKIMSSLPEFIKRMQAETAGLPKPRDYKSLTPDERNKLNTLLAAPAGKP